MKIDYELRVKGIVVYFLNTETEQNVQRQVESEVRGVRLVNCYCFLIIFGEIVSPCNSLIGVMDKDLKRIYGVHKKDNFLLLAVVQDVDEEVNDVNTLKHLFSLVIIFVFVRSCSSDLEVFFLGRLLKHYLVIL